MTEKTPKNRFPMKNYIGIIWKVKSKNPKDGYDIIRQILEKNYNPYRTDKQYTLRGNKLTKEDIKKKQKSINLYYKNINNEGWELIGNITIKLTEQTIDKSTSDFYMAHTFQVYFNFKKEYLNIANQHRNYFINNQE